MNNSNLVAELVRAIQTGSDGASFNPDGTPAVLRSGQTVVTVACGEAEPARDPAWIMGKWDLPMIHADHHDGVVVGVYRMPNGRYSVDLNAVVWDAAQAMQFAIANRQESIYTIDAYGEGRLVRTGNTPAVYEQGARAITPAQIRRAFAWLLDSSVRAAIRLADIF